MVFSDVCNHGYPFICLNAIKLVGGWHRDNMSTKDAVRNGNSAMMEAAVRSLGAEAANGAELRSSARRTERAGNRREPCRLNVRSSAKVGLELVRIGTDPDVRAMRVPPPEWTDPRMWGQETLVGHGMWRVRAAPPWIRQRLWWEREAPPELVEGWITYRLHCQQHTATEGCHDPELLLTDLLSHG